MFFFFFNDTATTEIYTLSLHDALPICRSGPPPVKIVASMPIVSYFSYHEMRKRCGFHSRSEEHTSELQSRQYLVCRLLLEKKKNTLITITTDAIRYMLSTSRTPH